MTVMEADQQRLDFNYDPYWEAARAASLTDSAHDLQHVGRVLSNADKLLATEGGRAHIVRTAVLLHELFNYPKGHPSSHLSGDVCADLAEGVLRENGFPEADIPLVATCIREHSFSKRIVPDTLEGKLVQDADRLDAIGAIGIARCFATCEQMGRPFYDPADPFCTNRPPDDKQWGVDHFYRKLLRLQDGMHTATAHSMAVERTRFMERFLEQLGSEM